MRKMATKRFEGKVVLITGGGTGIGKGAAIAFAKEGAKVVIASRNLEVLNKAVLEIKQYGEAVAIQTDVTKEKDVENLVSETVKIFGRVDIGINNSGSEGKPGRLIHELEEKDFDDLYAVNFKGPFFLLKYQIKQFLNQGKGGVIINIGTGMTDVAYPRVSPYIISKVALTKLSQLAAVEYGKNGIRVLTVSPGPIDTDMYTRFVGGEEGKEAFGAKSLVGFYGVPEDIASAILFAAENRFITGANLVVDGGISVANS